MRRRLAFESLDQRRCFALGDVVTGFAQSGEVEISYPLNGAISSWVVDTVALPDGQLILANSIGSNGTVYTLIKLDTSGQLDNTFGTNGQQHFIDPLTPNSQLVQVVPLADGRVLMRTVLSGLIDSLAYEQTNLIVLNSAGSIDTTFGIGGFLRLDSRQMSPWTIVPDRSGGFFVVGNPPTVPQTVLTRYTPAGALDVAFGQSGVVAVAGVSDPHAFVDNQNRLTIWGNKPFATTTVAYRFLSNGATDTAYGTAGVVQVSRMDIAVPTVFADDGESFLQLTRSLDLSMNRVTKYLANFQLDISYGVSGTREVDTLPSSTNVVKLTQLANGGALLVSSLVVSPPNSNIVLQAARLTPTGNFDTSYGVQGTSVLTIASNGFGRAAVSVDERGGFYWTQRSGPFSTNFLAAHTRADGSVDSQFGAAGVSNVDVLIQASGISLLQLEPQLNRRVRIQSGWPGGGQSVGALGQSTTLDANGNSVQASSFGSAIPNSISSSAPSADGGWFIAQNASPDHGGGQQLIVTRYRSDGTLNTSFGNSGRMTIDTNEIARIFTRSASDGSVVIVVDCWQNSNTTLGLSTILRLKNNGELDTNFGNSGLLRLSGQPLPVSSGNVETGSIIDVQIDHQSGVILVHNFYGLSPVYLQRLTAAGAIDLQFGTDGQIQVTEVGEWSATEIDEDGRILLITIKPVLLDYEYNLTQWTARGALISSFGQNGSVVLPIDPVLALPHVEMEARQGLIMIAASHDPNNTRLRLVALDYAGQRWSELGSDGTRDYELSTDGEMVADMEFASDGSIWLGTYEREGLNSVGKVIKLQGTSFSPLRNWFTALDVNADFMVTPFDALIIIGVLNGLPRPSGMYPDTNGDAGITPLDALLVINYLNSNPSGEGEGRPENNPDDAATSLINASSPVALLDMGYDMAEWLKSLRYWRDWQFD